MPPGTIIAIVFLCLIVLFLLFLFVRWVYKRNLVCEEYNKQYQESHDLQNYLEKEYEDDVRDYHEELERERLESQEELESLE